MPEPNGLQTSDWQSWYENNGPAYWAPIYGGQMPEEYDPFADYGGSSGYGVAGDGYYQDPGSATYDPFWDLDPGSATYDPFWDLYPGGGSGGAGSDPVLSDNGNVFDWSRVPGADAGGDPLALPGDPADPFAPYTGAGWIPAADSGGDSFLGKIGKALGNLVSNSPSTPPVPRTQNPNPPGFPTQQGLSITTLLLLVLLVVLLLRK